MNGARTDTRGGAVRRPTRAASVLRWCAGALAVCAALVAGSPVELLRAQDDVLRRQDDVPQDVEDFAEPIARIVVEGNTTIAPEEIESKIRVRAGRAVTREQIRQDVKALYDTRWFFSVETRYRRDKDGLVLVFRVTERPVLKSVAFKGNKGIKSKTLTSLTGLVSGGAFDVSLNREACRRIEAHYHEKGYVYATVELEKGNDRDDREVVFLINEGPKVRVTSINFRGNAFINDAMLKLKVKSSARKLWLIDFGNKFDPANIPEDVQGLKDYYTSLGFFDVEITPKQRESADRSQVELEYVVNEGPRYKVRNVVVSGNKVFQEKNLLFGTKLTSNQFFTERALAHDVEKITNMYGEQGRLFTKVDARPQFLEEPGTVDLVYQIEEDVVRRIGRIDVNINGDHPHTKVNVVLNRIGIKPGDLADPKKIRRAQNWLRGELFAGPMPGDPEGPKIAINPQQDARQLAETTHRETIIRAQGIIDPNAPPDAVQELYPNQGYMDRALQDPLVDLGIDVTETQTGRLMLGAGFNTDVGVVGSFVLEEKNFDIFRVPTSWEDMWDGTAFRGNGQQFRLEAVPGQDISRYLVSFREPYLFDTDISLGVSGFYYTRFYPDWDEKRVGGRISLGRQFTNELSGSIALRMEDVELKNPTFPTPGLLAESIGSNFLSTVRASVAHDTRDRPFLPGRGHYVELAYEQGIADFTFPRGEISGQQYFTTTERPDGSGRQIISLLGNVGYTGNDTPIFERYFAGGFQSFRGFAFRGVSPVDLGKRVGGQFQALGTLEYLLPITADDRFGVVAFTDFGTVENDVAFEDFRLSVGGGLRITIDALGPAPIALDWTVPVIKEDFDDERIFSLYFGFSR